MKHRILNFLYSNWIGIVAVASFLLSSSMWIHTLVTQRKSLNFKITEFKSYEGVTYFYLITENKSRLPISITNIRLYLGENYYDCSHVSNFLWSNTTNITGKPIDTRRYYSLAMPIQITPLGSVGGYIFYTIPQAEMPKTSTHLSLSTQTNRGRAIQTTLELPEGRRTP